MTGLRVIKAGVLATLQDWGRYGQRLNGLSTGGPMDEHGFLWANHLLNNDPKSTCIEITVGLSVFESISHATIAVCGADMDFMINQNKVKNWATHTVRPKDILSFRSARDGLRAYLAIQNGFNVKPYLGSTATVIREKLGGINGGALANGDVIGANPQTELRYQRIIPSQFLPQYTKTVELKFFPSYQYESFKVDQQQAFVKNSFTVSQRMDRMGCRLEGDAIQYDGGGIISEGISIGSIQVPPDGQPIVLLKDSGSVGGYPKLGCVTRLSLNKLAQSRSGNKINFMATDHQSETARMIEFYRFFNIDV